MHFLVFFLLLFILNVHAFAQSGTPRLKLDPLLQAPQPRQNGAVFIRADRMSGKNQVEAEGEVELRTREQTIKADWLRYDLEADEIWGKGNVRLRNLNDLLSGPEMRYKRSDATGFVREPEFSLGQNQGRGCAAWLSFLGPDRYLAKEGQYTTCASGKEDWWLKTSQLELDNARQVGEAKHATIYFKGVPILYAPWLDFSLSNERNSGFLTPSFGSTGNRGIDVSVPYYWNIAANYDATFTPRIMTKRGLQLQNQFRYLQASFNGEAVAEILPNDRITKNNRHALLFKHNHLLWPGLTASLNLNRVSDDNYFVDLADRISITSQTTLPREAVLNYHSAYGNLFLRVQRFQTLQDVKAPILPPYERMPQLVFNTQRLNWYGFDTVFNSEYVRFEHPTQITGQRFIAYPQAIFPLRSSGWFVIPKAGLRLSRYALDEDSGDFLDTTRGIFHDSNLSIPLFSIDSGLIFERDWRLFGRNFLHTLEPRLYYLNVPFVEQNQVPNFDSALADFNFAQLFSENRYVGNDRIGDANELTLAVTSRLLDPLSGDERLRLGVGRRLYFRDQRVLLSEAPRRARSSDYLFTASGRLSKQWWLDSGLQFNTTLNRTERFNLSARYQPAPGKVLNLSYRYVRELFDSQGRPTQIKQIDLSGQWPLFNNWYLAGRWNFSQFDRRLLEGLAGLEYNGGCWVFRIVGQRIATATQTFTNSVFVQLELNGLSRIGNNPLEVLQRNIPGYTKLNEPYFGNEPRSSGQPWYQPNY